MNLAELLSQVVEIKGVTSASVVSGDGLIVESASRANVDIGFVSALIASSLASSRVLAGLLGEGELQQAMIEFENGPVLITPLHGDSEDTAYVAVVTLESPSTLGRVRFQLKRLLPDIAAQVAV